MLGLTFANKEDYNKIQEDDSIDIVGLTSFAPDKPLTIVLHHKDGSQESFPVNHTYNAGQIDWFKAGSALNLMAKKFAEEKKANLMPTTKTPGKTVVQKSVGKNSGKNQTSKQAVKKVATKAVEKTKAKPSAKKSAAKKAVTKSAVVKKGKGVASKKTAPVKKGAAAKKITPVKPAKRGKVSVKKVVKILAQDAAKAVKKMVRKVIAKKGGKKK
jgi:aconitate hydratase